MLDADISTNEALALLHRPETAGDPYTLDRRRFLQLVGMGMGAGLIATPGTSLLEHVLLGHDPSAWAAGPIGANDGVLVVIGMFGGNDGLNTVVPFNDGNYYTQHGGLALSAANTLPLTTDLGLNPALTEIKHRWDAGQVAVVQGVGYPNADFSHFNSMAYWMAGRVGGIPTSGWLGRWLDGYLGSGRDLFAAAEVGYSVPLHLVGDNQRGTVVPRSRPGFGTGTNPVDVRMYQAIRGMQTGNHGPWHGAVGQAFVDQLDLASTLAAHYPDDDALPDSDIVASLEIAARMINANLGFRVLTAGWGDFDSHANQPGMHTARMEELNAAIARFFTVLNPAWATRVTLMTFSEFGRTSWDNDGQGTDHGSSAPHFVIGNNVKGGLYGLQPSLAGLNRWDRMAHHVDFRSYYASIIDGWLGGGSSDVLGGNYENLGLFARGPGQNPDGTTARGPAVMSPPSCFVPITPFRLVDTRDGTGGVLTRPLGPAEPIVVPIAGQGPVPATGVTAVAVNVTAVDVSEPNFFTVYPGSTARPWTSNLNAGPGRPVPNLVVMGVGSDGCIEVFNSTGSAHCLVDVFGYFTASSGDRFTPVAPARLFDTREGLGIQPGKVPPATPIEVQVAGNAGVPPTGATAVVLNLTVTEPESDGWMRATPAGQAAASTSNVNFAAWDVAPNLVICKIGDGGRITIDGHGIGSHVVGDVFGYFGPNGNQLRTLPPQRLLDTREGLGAELRPVGPAHEVRLAVGGKAQVPSGATAVVLNVTATNVAGYSYVTVWPDGEDRPSTSNLNVAPGQTVANLVICRLGSGGALRLASPNGDCDLIADVLGFFAA
jgi:uncharacterized protein (DUF1501 family)